MRLLWQLVAVSVFSVLAIVAQPSAARTANEDTIQDVLMFNGVYLFGDSIAKQDGPALERRLLSRSGDPIAMDSRPGRATREAVDVLEDWSHRYGLPTRIVMAVGSNDVFDPRAFASQVERTMRIAGPDRTVFWVDVYVRRTRQPGAVQAVDQRNSALINRQLEAAAGRHPRLRVIHWAEFLTARPSRIRTSLRDGVHTTVPTGQDARNQLIVDALTQPR
ncbi:hypothetical protein [Kribbella sp.]|uniref:hypothetical protein n=1 Tax=Kribbella sp. TaxID=1871183 RepID=UPI002D2FFB0B|nr:hypothetical protein [Kribbella sp.]HZX05135.1 hypothetical protein [Kribbella sp.]